jgi:hypothetical protein
VTARCIHFFHQGIEANRRLVEADRLLGGTLSRTEAPSVPGYHTHLPNSGCARTGKLAADKPTMRQGERMLRLARRGQRAAKMMTVSERSVTSASFVTKHAPNLVSKLEQG